ncbi:CDK2-associated and cullin domain-containing protein 1-like [Suncus etruscus]|uniref:CDK2-associated and cullin domain-containing protein 1-like n=1 Tax=Suncus etruscus TaxID=109475 RepID=UPI00210F2544|nr:CDK2-associated and cullin domain-containing protein 1-like [Suncus etruscus]
MEESMEEEEGGGYEAMMDDQKHNHREAAGFRPPPAGLAAPARPPPPPPPAPAPAAPAPRKGLPRDGPAPEHNGVVALLKGCDAAALAAPAGPKAAAPGPGPGPAGNINTSASKFLMNVITIEDYKSTYWPKLDGAIDQLLTQSPGELFISYEQIYSCVYKCVCQQHSEQMYSDLIKKITSHLQRVSEELQDFRHSCLYFFQSHSIAITSFTPTSAAITMVSSSFYLRTSSLLPE